MRSALIATAMLFSLTATAAPARYELVHPRVCLAGGWGDPHAEWRVQLAITSSERFALAFEQRLAKRGIHAEHYIAVWRANVRRRSGVCGMRPGLPGPHCRSRNPDPGPGVNKPCFRFRQRMSTAH